MNSLPSIDLSVGERLKKDPAFRQRFFIAKSSAKIAQQLIGLRKRRALNQTQLAKKLKTGQPAISRVESADYLNWSFATLRKFAAALDARIQVIIRPSEDVLPEYEEAAAQETDKAKSSSAAAKSAADFPPLKAQNREMPEHGAATADPPRRPLLQSLPF